MDLSVEDARSFCAVAQEAIEPQGAAGSLSAVADMLGIPQPTLSRRIMRVERTVKAQLFDRAAGGGRGMVLNERGRTFLPHARRIVEERDAGVAAIARLMDPEVGTVRLDFMHSLGTWLVPTLLREYRQEYPHANFVLHQGASKYLIERVREDAADVALVGPPPGEDEQRYVDWHPLEKQSLALGLPADHPLAQDGEGVPIRISQARNEPFVGMLPGYGTRILLDKLTSQAGFQPQLVFESMELTTVTGLVSAGFGVALLPLNDPYLAPTGIVLRPLEPMAYREIGLVTRAGVTLPPPVAAFKEAVMRQPAQTALQRRPS